MRKKLTVAGLSSFLVAALIPVAAFAATVVEVGTLESGGWTLDPAFADNRAGGSMALSAKYGAPEGYGVRSLEIGTIDDTAKAQLAHPFASPVPLSGVDELSYSTYRSSASTGASHLTPSINLAIDYNGIDEVGGSATLVYEPIYQTGGAAAVQSDIWQNWDAAGEGIWWSTSAFPGVPEAFTSYVSFDAIKEANPDALVESFIINQGSGNGGLLAGVDAFNFDGTVYNFEGKPFAATTMAECRDGAWVNTYVTVYKNLGDCISSVAPVRY